MKLLELPTIVIAEFVFDFRKETHNVILYQRVFDMKHTYIGVIMERDLGVVVEHLPSSNFFCGKFYLADWKTYLS